MHQMNLEPHYFYLCQDFSALIHSGKQSSKFHVSSGIDYMSYDMTNLEGNCETAWLFPTWVIILANWLPHHCTEGKCVLWSLPVPYFFFFPFPRVLAIQCKAPPRHPSLHLSYKSILCSESKNMVQNTRCLL